MRQRCRARWHLALVVSVVLASASGADTRVGIEGTRFTVDGTPTFLWGMSYYAALGAPEETVRRDLDEMRRRGFNWVRVWANWSAFENDVSAVDAQGRAKEPYLTKLKGLLAECARRAMVVDVTLTRGNGVAGPPRLATHAAHRRAVETLITALKSYSNWHLDLSNERNIGDARFTSVEELTELRKLARHMDPRRLVTASHGGDIGREELRDYVRTVQVDFIAPHRPRGNGSAAQTEAKTQEYLAWMRELGPVVPVHYQEPFRRGYAAWQPTVQDFITDARGALTGGAAGWCFHNGDQRGAPDGRPRRSFDLRDRGLFEQLDPEERKALKELEQLILPIGGSKR
jgi:hypothetical protein